MVCIRAGYRERLAEILKTVENNPYDPSQHFERLIGNLKGFCSREINHHNRFVYKVLPNDEDARDNTGELYDGIVLVFEAWGHKYKNPKK